jgi:cytoplasmic iron level regulating protein YaaA (DUF328/UPF0246 family)
MKPVSSTMHELTTPQFIDQATLLNRTLQKMNKAQLIRLMDISSKVADDVERRIDRWSDGATGSAAALTFRGDIYSGLSADQWNEEDAAFAQQRLLILSGLYGLLRPFDNISPYRLEMGYKLKLDDGLNLDNFWEREVASTLNTSVPYINLTAKEYYKVVRRRLSESEVISPKFLTVSEKTGSPIFVTVHAKIARGSFANWLIKNRVDDPKEIVRYDLLNYKYDASLSSGSEPVFVCQKFGGLGLSVRLK